MSEKEPKRRGRSPKKEEGQSTSQSEPTSSQPEVTTQATQTAGTPDVKDPVAQATHQFMKTLYREGGDVLSALSVAQDAVFTNAGPAESFHALNSMTALGLEVAEERGDQALIDSLTSKQRAFSSALRRLSPLQGPAGINTGPTNPSNLPPMTGRKG